jgi:hypothetical protein
MIMVILVSTRHEDLCPHDLTLEKAIENKRIRRSIRRDETTKVSPEIFHVLAVKDLVEEIAPDYRIRIGGAVVASGA